MLANCFIASKTIKILAIDGHHGILRTDGEHWKSVRTDTIALIHRIGFFEKCRLEEWASFFSIFTWKRNFWTVNRILFYLDGICTR